MNKAKTSSATRSDRKKAGSERLRVEARSVFPIVGVGASAGGVEAFQQLLSNLPADTGMAFVLLQHLYRTHPSLLAEVLAKATPMPVLSIEDGLPTLPNHVYVHPSGVDAGILHGVLTTVARAEGRR